MKNTFQTAKRFREVILNGTWIANTNFKDQLGDLHWKTATTALGPLNTIAVLAQHIHYYIDGINNVFKGGTLDIKDVYSFDFRPVASQDDWVNFLAKFWKDAETFAALIEQMPEEKLQDVFTDEKYGNYFRNLHGIIEHTHYHLGQIALIKKIVLHNNN